MATIMINSVSQEQLVSDVILTASEMITKVEFFDEVTTHVKHEFRDWVKQQFSDLSFQIENLPELLEKMQNDLIKNVPIEQIELIIKLFIG